MKRALSILLSLVMCLAMLPLAAPAAEAATGDVTINATNFPDAKFRSYVKSNFDTNGNGVLSAAEINNVIEIDVKNQSITSLKGVEYLSALLSLDCSGNQLTALDVSKNTALQYLACSENQLTKLDVSRNTKLNWLNCNNNQLTALDVSKNTALWVFNCSENQLTKLDVSQNTALTGMVCNGNQLTTLNVSKNTALMTLSCQENQLTALDVSKNTALTSLDCSGNRLTKLDVSRNTKLDWLDCGQNQLTALNVSGCAELRTLNCPDNQLTSLKIGSSAYLLKAYQNGVRSACYESWIYKYTTDGVFYFFSVDKSVAIDTTLPPTVITSQPKSVSAKVGSTVKMTVAATGAGLTYQWQIKTPAATSWVNSTASSGKSASLSVAVTAGKNGYQYRCVITDANGKKVTSNAAKLTVNTTITTQPKSVSAKVGNTVKMTVAATGAGLTYQWQIKTPAATSWVNSTAASGKTASLSVAVTAGKNGYQYRCVITDANGKKVTSNAAKLTVNTTITTQPKSVSAKAGSTVKMTVAATGAGLTYQWQIKTPAATSWVNSTAASGKTASLSVAVTAGKNGYQYRCVITDANGNKAYTSAATLTVTK